VSTVLVALGKCKPRGRTQAEPVSHHPTPKTPSSTMSTDTSTEVESCRSSISSCSNAKTHCETKCVPVEYELCDKKKANVPLLAKFELWAPKIGNCVEIVKDKNHCATKLCINFEGWQKCDEQSFIVKGLLKEELHGPHFKRCKNEKVKSKKNKKGKKH
jgi:hypothetical protein